MPCRKRPDEAHKWICDRLAVHLAGFPRRESPTFPATLLPATHLDRKHATVLAAQIGVAGQRLSADFEEAYHFPGGSISTSNTNTFPESSSFSGSLVNLTAGGLRLPHWHTPSEWAFVLRGTCR